MLLFFTKDPTLKNIHTKLEKNQMKTLRSDFKLLDNASGLWTKQDTNSA